VTCQDEGRRAHSNPRLRRIAQGSNAPVAPCSHPQEAPGRWKGPLLLKAFSFISALGTSLDSTGQLEQPLCLASSPVQSLASLHTSNALAIPKPPANKAGRAPAGNQTFLWWRLTPGSPQHPGHVPARGPQEGSRQTQRPWDTLCQVAAHGVCKPSPEVAAGASVSPTCAAVLRGVEGQHR